MPVSNIEYDFVLKAISSGVRLDNRSFEEYRELKFEFSTVSRGNLTLSLGQTR